jgi:hypothetical protein
MVVTVQTNPDSQSGLGRGESCGLELTIFRSRSRASNCDNPWLLSAANPLDNMLIYGKLNNSIEEIKFAIKV